MLGFNLLYRQSIDNTLACWSPSVILLPLHMRTNDICEVFETEMVSKIHGFIASIFEYSERHAHTSRMVITSEVLLISNTELTVIKETIISEEWITSAKEAIHQVHVLIKYR